MSNLLALTKFAVTSAAGLTVGKVIKDVVKNNTTAVTRFDTVMINIGGYILGSMVADKAQEHFSKQLDEAIAKWKKKGKDEDESKDKEEKSEEEK